jgi:hypothetical protein
VLQSAERQTGTNYSKNRNTRLVKKNIIAQLIIGKRGIFKKHLVYTVKIFIQ